MVALDDAFEGLGVGRWPIIIDLRLEGDSAIFLNFLRQFLDHLFLLKDRAVEAIYMRLHWRWFICITAASLSVTESIAVFSCFYLKLLIVPATSAILLASVSISVVVFQHASSLRIRRLSSQV